jgi:NAD(P)-dependent dehydrogenase (short-subunit alcohol dehydrogenase family)
MENQSGEAAGGRVVVVTGSTRGIGYGLADSFLARGCRVVLHGRTADGLAAAAERLAARHGTALRGRIAVCAGDAADPDTHRRLWESTVAAFGRVDIWINNAGVGHPDRHLADLDPETVAQVVDIDLKGLVYGCQTAIRGMKAQGFGQLYNMEGFGSDGMVRPGLTVYGAAKAAVRYLNKGLAAELKGSPVQAGALSPGMVATEFISSQYRDDPAAFERAKRIFNILADRPETVTPWLADKVLAKRRSGRRIAWLSRSKIFWRFLSAGFRKRDVFGA